MGKPLTIICYFLSAALLMLSGQVWALSNVAVAYYSLFNKLVCTEERLPGCQWLIESLRDPLTSEIKGVA